MVIRVVEFSREGYKMKNTQRKWLNFENWCNFFFGIIELQYWNFVRYSIVLKFRYWTFSIFNTIELRYFNIQWYWNFSIENFQYSIVLKFRYWTFSIFNSIEISVLNNFGIQYYWTSVVTGIFGILGSQSPPYRTSSR